MTKITNAQLKTLLENNATTTNTNFLKAKQAIATKVDAVSGKGLSTEDYTTAEKTKLAGIEAGAQVNVIETVKVNGTALTADANKAVDVTVPVYTIAEAQSATSGYLKTYVLKADGVEVQGSKIDIPKDYLVKSATMGTCSTADTPLSGMAVGDPYLDFVVNTKDNSGTDEHIYINVKGLVDTYTAGTGISITNNAISIDDTVVATKSYVTGQGYQTADDVNTALNDVLAGISITAWDDIVLS